jgi:hypothetical protein
MQSNSKLSIKSYLDIYQILKDYKINHEENRSFALKHKELETKPIELLLLWAKAQRHRIKGDLISKKYAEYSSSINSLFGIISLIFGFLVGFGLLSYSGKMPVNVIYYLLIVVAIPIVSITLSTIAIFTKSNTVANFITLLFPMHWLESIFKHIPFKKRIEGLELPFSSKFSKLLFINRLQLYSLIFSIGIFLALLIMVVSKDIAFGWTTTLQIESSTFHSILSAIGIWWRDLVPSAIPSVELIDMSHFFRLGERLDSSIIQNADKLGAWWKYLAMATLFYSIILRLLFWLFTSFLLKRELTRELLALNGVKEILHNFQTPFISTQSSYSERELVLDGEKKEAILKDKKELYSAVLGWNFTVDEINLVNDNKDIKAESIFQLGGGNSFEVDKKIVDSLKGTILLYVKSWEPPTMDFLDTLELLVENRAIKRIEILPVGLAKDFYRNREEDLDVWKRKVGTIKSDKVWIIDYATK